MNNIKKTTLFVSLFFATAAQAQINDSIMIRKIYDEVLKNSECYQNLAYLCSNIGGRLSGSPQAAKAVDWGKNVMEGLNPTRVELQPVMVPHWVRGEKEKAPRVYVGATKEEQALICVQDAGDIIKSTEQLRNGFEFTHYNKKVKRIICGDGFMAAVGQDSTTLDGLDPSMAIIDEYMHTKKIILKT
jgi:ribosomal protein L11 methylase PrmA